MWTWTLNWGAIRPDLLVGSCPMGVEDLDRIQTQAGASAVLSLQSDLCLEHFRIDYPAHRDYGRGIGLEMRRAPMRDFDPPDQRHKLAEAVRMLHTLLHQGHRVYVHCTAGMGRAPLTVLAYLGFVEGLQLPQALALIHRARPCAVPALEAYEGCKEDLLRAHESEIRQWAQTLYTERCRSGCPDHPEADWARAEREVLRRVITAQTMGPD